MMKMFRSSRSRTLLTCVVALQISICQARTTNFENQALAPRAGSAESGRLPFLRLLVAGAGILMAPTILSAKKSKFIPKPLPPLVYWSLTLAELALGPSLAPVGKKFIPQIFNVPHLGWPYPKAIGIANDSRLEFNRIENSKEICMNIFIVNETFLTPAYLVLVMIRELAHAIYHEKQDLQDRLRSPDSVLSIEFEKTAYTVYLNAANRLVEMVDRQQGLYEQLRRSMKEPSIPGAQEFLDALKGDQGLLQRETERAMRNLHHWSPRAA